MRTYEYTYNQTKKVCLVVLSLSIQQSICICCSPLESKTDQTPDGQLSCPLVPTFESQCGINESKVGLGSRVDRDCPELSLHAQVLPDHNHQSHAGDVDEPPGQGSWKVGVVDPAADHVEEVDSHGEVQALLPSADEKPQAEGTCKRI